MKNKTLMIIGAGFGQLPAIQTAKRMGLRVVALDRNMDALGMKWADVPLAIDVVDFDGAIRAARENAIDGVMTMQTDLPVPTIGAVVDALGLPGVGLEVANRCSNKIETRELFAKAGVPQPDFRVVTSVEEAMEACDSIGYPTIIKPPDSSGSRGVTKVKARENVAAAFQHALSFSRGKRLLVEEFIDGEEIGSQGFSLDGKTVKVLVHNDMLSRPPYLVPVGHSFPSRLPAPKLAIAEEATARCLEALGIPRGPSNIDLILDANNNPRVVEVGARIGATCLPELVQNFTGIDWVEQTILTALGERPNLTATQAVPTAAYILECSTDGILKGFEIPESVRNHPNILEVEVTATIGETVNLFRKGTDRVGKVVTRGESLDEAENLADWARKQVRFDIEAGK